MKLKKYYPSLLLKLIVILSAVAGTIMSASAGNGSFMGGTTVFLYFTIQSNLALALLCLIGGVLLLSKKSIPKAWYVVRFVGTVSITLTGVVFCVVLAPTLGMGAWKLSNVLTHVVVPLASILDFFLVAKDVKIEKRNIPYILLPPIAYVIFAAVGYFANWNFAGGVNYPYFFLNWGSPAGAFGFCAELPFMGCVWWILLLSAFILSVGFIYLAVLNALNKK